MPQTTETEIYIKNKEIILTSGKHRDETLLRFVPQTS